MLSENRKYKSRKIFPLCYSFLENSAGRAEKGRRIKRSACKEEKYYRNTLKYSGQTQGKNIPTKNSDDWSSDTRNYFRRNIVCCWRERSKMIHPQRRDPRDEMSHIPPLYTDVNTPRQDRSGRPTYYHLYHSEEDGNLYIITFIYYLFLYLSPIYYQYQYIIFA